MMCTQDAEYEISVDQAIKLNAFQIMYCQHCCDKFFFFLQQMCCKLKKEGQVPVYPPDCR